MSNLLLRHCFNFLKLPYARCIDTWTLNSCIFKKYICLSPSNFDHYKVLGVNRNASAKEIKNAYFNLAKKYHPDANPGNKAAAEKFQKISLAYEVLGNKEKKLQYDTFGSDAQGPFNSSSSYQNQGHPFTGSQQWSFHQMSGKEAEELFKNVFKDFSNISGSKKSPFNSMMSGFFAGVGSKLVQEMMKKENLSKFKSNFEEYELKQGPNGIEFVKKTKKS